MPVEVTLAEIIQEGRRTIDKWAPNVSDPIRDVTGVPIRVGTLRRLLAVAEAGDRLYDYVHHAPICAGTSERPCDCGLVEALAAWDAAARGEGKTDE